MNRFDFVHEQIEKASLEKLNEFERFKKKRQDELIELAKIADIQADGRRMRKQRVKRLSLD